MTRTVKRSLTETAGLCRNMRQALCRAALAVILAATAGAARAEGRWTAPTNGWAHNYVAIAGSGPGSGRPEQFDAKWAAVGGYQSSNPAADNYVAITNDVSEGDVLRLVHLDSTANKYPYYQMTAAPGAGTTNEFITLDCRFRLADASQADTMPQLHLSVCRPRPDGLAGMAFWYIRCSESRVEYLNSAASFVVLGGTTLGTNWHTVRLVIDVARDTASLYFDRVAEPVITWASRKDGANAYNRVDFGDGSGGIKGAAHIKYLRWTTNELVTPAAFVHEGAADPAAEGWAYQPVNLLYASSNNLLPTAAAPGWAGNFQAGTTTLTNDDITGESALHLDMTNTNALYTYALYQQAGAPGRFTTNDLVTCDFRFRVLDAAQAESQGQLSLGLNGPRTDGAFGRQNFYMRFAKDRITYYNNSGAFATYLTPLSTNWHTVSWRCNWQTREAEVYLDGSPTASFSHKSALLSDVSYNFTSFGDGSSGIQGIVRVGHLQLTRHTLAWQGGAEADTTPYWQGGDGDGGYGYYEGAVPAAVMTNAQGWTASCKLRVPQASEHASGVTLYCNDNANKWGLTFTPTACYYPNADGNLIQLGAAFNSQIYHTFQLRYDPVGNSGGGTVSYFKDGWLLTTLTRADVYTNSAVTNVLRWGCDGVPDATNVQRWNIVEFAPGNRVIAPVPRDGTLISIH